MTPPHLAFFGVEEGWSSVDGRGPSAWTLSFRGTSKMAGGGEDAPWGLRCWTVAHGGEMPL